MMSICLVREIVTGESSRAVVVRAGAGEKGSSAVELFPLWQKCHRSFPWTKASLTAALGLGSVVDDKQVNLRKIVSQKRGG
jgi:hypothetical protein